MDGLPDIIFKIVFGGARPDAIFLNSTLNTPLRQLTIFSPGIFGAGPLRHSLTDTFADKCAKRSGQNGRNLHLLGTAVSKGRFWSSEKLSRSFVSTRGGIRLTSRPRAPKQARSAGQRLQEGRHGCLFPRKCLRGLPSWSASSCECTGFSLRVLLNTVHLRSAIAAAGACLWRETRFACAAPNVRVPRGATTHSLPPWLLQRLASPETTCNPQIENLGLAAAGGKL